MPVRRIAHLCIHTPDLEATRRFYCDALGLQVAFRFLRGGHCFGYYFKVGEHSFLEAFEGRPGESGAIKHLALEVEDMDAVIARLRTAGHEVGDKTLGADHTWQAWLSDPAGVRIELHEYTEASCQHTGADCLIEE